MSFFNKILAKLFVLSIQKYFLVVSIFIGLLYLFFIPPFQNVDEASHYYRSIGIAKGARLVKKDNLVGAYLPAKYKLYGDNYAYLIKNIDAKIYPKQQNLICDDNNLIFISYSNTALYAAIAYLPSLPIAYISNFIDLSPQTLFYIMRFSNLLTYILLGYLVLSLLPCLQLPMLILLLLPMNLSLGASITSDVVLLGVNFLWFSYVIKFMYSESKITKIEVFNLFLLAGLIGLCKNYFMTIFLILLIPFSHFPSKIRYYFINISLILFGMLSSFLWANHIKDLVVPLNGVANPFAQVSYIFNNFFEYIIVSIKSIIIKLPRIIITMVGVLGWQDTRLDFVTYAFYPVLFLIAVGCSDFNFILEKWKNKFLIILFFSSVFLVATYMYISWSALGSNIILGLNGKYFIPLMPILILLLKNLPCLRCLNVSENMCKKIIYVFIFICLCSSVLSVLHRYYGLTPNLYYSV